MICPGSPPVPDCLPSVTHSRSAFYIYSSNSSAARACSAGGGDNMLTEGYSIAPLEQLTLRRIACSCLLHNAARWNSVGRRCLADEARGSRCAHLARLDGCRPGPGRLTRRRSARFPPAIYRRTPRTNGEMKVRVKMGLQQPQQQQPTPAGADESYAMFFFILRGREAEHEMPTQTLLA